MGCMSGVHVWNDVPQICRNEWRGVWGEDLQDVIKTEVAVTEVAVTEVA